jgi:hypothetical protein
MKAEPPFDMPLHYHYRDGHDCRGDASQNDADDCETLAIGHGCAFTFLLNFAAFGDGAVDLVDRAVEPN